MIWDKPKSSYIWDKGYTNLFGHCNKSAIKTATTTGIEIATNLVQHPWTKHTDICHHFIRDHQAKDDVTIKSVCTKDQLAIIFTKPLNEVRCCKLRNKLNILEFFNINWLQLIWLSCLSFDLSGDIDWSYLYMLY